MIADSKPVHTGLPDWLKVTSDVQFEVEQLLYYEAMLLDERRFGEWLDLFDSDVTYRMYTRVNQRKHDARRSSITVGVLPLFDDTIDILQTRVKRLADGDAWAEEPPTRTRRIVSNIRVKPHEEDGYRVESNFILYCSRRERDEYSYIGSKVDLLRRGDSPIGWKVTKRTIQLEQSVLLAPNISVFL